jgi:phenylacetate-CoA ligase
MQEGVSHGDLTKLSMSGNSGEPLTTFVDKGALEFRWAASLRFRDWTGYRFGQPTARFWNEGLGLSQAQAAKAQADARFANRLLLPAFRLDPESIAGSLRALSKHRPALIEGPAEVLLAIAESSSSAQLEYKPKAVLVHGQELTEAQRATIGKTFDCKVFDLYRTGELGEVACEVAADGGLFVAAEGYIVEVLVGDRPARLGEQGDVYVTDLSNRCMPLIRYATGDRAVALGPDATVPNARGLPRIGKLVGRRATWFQGLDGARVPASFFSALFSEYAFAVRRFRVEEAGPGALGLRLIKAPRYSDATLEEMSSRIRERLGSSLRIDVDFEDENDARIEDGASPRWLSVASH